MPVFRVQHGFSLMEVMIGVFLSTLLVSGIIQLLGGSVSVYRLQLSQGQLEESARYARDVLTSHISQAGYQPEPWQDQPELPALTDEALDGGLQPGDQLGLQRWSMQNCYGNEKDCTYDENLLDCSLISSVEFLHSVMQNILL